MSEQTFKVKSVWNSGFKAGTQCPTDLSDAKFHLWTQPTITQYSDIVQMLIFVGEV